MAEWSSWFDEVLPDVPGCSAALAANAIRNATIQFCEEARVLVVDHPLMSAVANQPSYTWAPGAGLKVVRAEQVWFLGRELPPITSDDLETRYASWTTESGLPEFHLQDQIEALRLVPYPLEAATDAIRARVSVRPSRAAAGVDDTVRERYLEEIARGAKARLMLMSRKPWTDQNLGAAMMGQFEDDIAKARLAAFKGWSRARNNSNRGYRRFV